MFLKDYSHAAGRCKEQGLLKYIGTSITVGAVAENQFLLCRCLPGFWADRFPTKTNGTDAEWERFKLKGYCE